MIPLIASNPNLTVVVPDANLSFAANRLNVANSRLTGIGFQKKLAVSPFEIFEIPAAHEEVERDEKRKLEVYWIGCQIWRMDGVSQRRYIAF